jgi:hypothetical protein
MHHYTYIYMAIDIYVMPIQNSALYICMAINMVYLNANEKNMFCSITSLLVYWYIL